MENRQDKTLVRPGELQPYFHRAVHVAADERGLGADQATLHYLTLLLCRYARSDHLFDYDQQRLQLRPLALVYAEALAAHSSAERRLWLQRLGDLALFVGGRFAGRLSRHFKDLDYCVAMGGNAYGYLGQTAARSGEQGLAQVFGELAERFERFVELVAMVTGQHGGERPRGARRPADSLNRA
jgi:hypothetical protein